MLPFLKDRHEGGMSAAVDEKIRRKPDEDSADEYGMLDAIAEDMIDAIHSKDKKVLKGALEALVQHIQDEDVEQDSEDFGGEDQ